MLRGRAGLEDSLDVDGHVAVGAAEAADDGEPEAVLAPLQLDHQGRAVHHRVARHAAVPRMTAGLLLLVLLLLLLLLLLLSSVSNSKASNAHLNFSR